MEKEQILSGLTEKLGQTSFSQRTLEKYIDLNPLADGAEPDEAYYTKAVDFLKGMEGQYSHELAAKVAEIKKDLEGKITPPTPPAPPTPPTPTKGDDELLKKFEELEKQLTELKNANTEAEGRRKQENLLKEVRKGMKAKNASDDYVLEKTLQGVELDDKKSVDELVKDMLVKYDAEFTACRGRGATPRNPQTGGGGAKTPVDDYFERKAKREGWGKKGS